MKKLFMLLAALGFAGCIGLTGIKSNPVMVRADDEITEPEPEDNSATVVIEKGKHGSVEASILEGVEGDVCELDVKAELLYLVKAVSVNGVALIEDENISGLYKFALVKGVNTVTAEFVVNEELLGELSNIYSQVRDKDWSSLFTVENLIAIIKWVFDCGILIAIIRYYIRDKRLANKVEKGVKQSVEKIIPEATRETVIATVRDVLEPIFAQIKADNIEMSKAMSVFAKCMALAQENSTESRLAIIELLSQLNLSDEKTLAEVKSYIDRLFAEHLNTYNEVMSKLDEIGSKKEEAVEETETVETIDVGDGTSI